MPYLTLSHGILILTNATHYVRISLGDAKHKQNQSEKTVYHASFDSEVLETYIIIKGAEMSNGDTCGCKTVRAKPPDS